MRVLIIGGNGMLGHKVYQVFSDLVETWATARRPLPQPWFDERRIVTPVDVADPSATRAVLASVRPDVVINAAGVVKQSAASSDLDLLATTNSWFPHRLSEMCADAEARLIHISTDCVYSGRRGGYVETDPVDPVDLYGASKALGEAAGTTTLTLRTSIIGPELAGQHGLLEWFLAREGHRVNGFSNAVFSGLPTVTLAKLLWEIVEKHQMLRSLYHVASDPITKLDLLNLLKSGFRMNVEIHPVEEPRIDRSLDSRRFEEETAWRAPAWPELVEELVRDVEAHREWRINDGSRR